MHQPTPCEVCREPFTASNGGAVRRFCSERCRYRAKRRPPRQCPVCLTTYRPVGLRQVACSVACANTGKHIGESCQVPYATCRCGELYVKIGRRIHCRAPRVTGVAWAGMNERRKAKVVTSSVGCLVCGAAMELRGQSLRRYCSDACRRGSANHRARKRRDKDNRAMRKRGVFVEPVSRRRVYDRDGWVCQLCRKPVSRTASVPNPKAPTLDHIIPLAAGGTHEYANVQLAHFLCNSRKSDGDAQLRWDIAA